VLVVISIITLLSSVVLSSLNSARSKGRDAQRIQTLRQIRAALEMYYDKYGNYPPSVYSTTGYASDMTTLPIAPEFIRTISLDPRNLDTAYGYYYARDYVVSAGGGCPSATTNDFILATRLENSSKAPTSCWNNPNLNYIIGNTSQYR
jgi:type II secretory pathway pseudopilin PulG